MNKKTFDKITIVSVTGDPTYIQTSIYAIQRSCNALIGSRGLLISPSLPDGVELPKDIVHKEISPFGYMEYNIFILYQLDYFIETEFCLLVQNDGWVLNADNWNDEFFNYDYIGAPVPSYFIRHSDGFTIESTEHYFKNLDLISNPNYIEPQNGGFSFRSKKLLGKPRELGLNYQVFPPKRADLTQTIYEFDWLTLTHNEDIFLSALHKDKLISNGIKFAPSHIALQFAVESMLLHQNRNMPLQNVFGGHFYGQIRLVEYNKVDAILDGSLAHEPLEKLKRIPIFWVLKNLGYNINFILKR